MTTFKFKPEDFRGFVHAEYLVPAAAGIYVPRETCVLLLDAHERKVIELSPYQLTCVNEVLKHGACSSVYWDAWTCLLDVENVVKFKKDNSLWELFHDEEGAGFFRHDLKTVPVEEIPKTAKKITNEMQIQEIASWLGWPRSFEFPEVVYVDQDTVYFRFPFDEEKFNYVLKREDSHVW